MQPALADFKKWYQAERPAIFKDFFRFLSFPSISTDPAHAADMRKTAQWLQSYLEEMGMECSLWETSVHPALFATHCKAGAERPTLLIYHHYDVQPVDPLHLWETPPFEPTVREGQVYARGALDNKGQCFYSITALKAALQLSKQLDVNIKIFIEGEEECGSHGTMEVLAKRKQELKADYLLVVDFDLPKAGTPGITLGTRGILTMHLECHNSRTDLHSGMHGGIALNPNRALVQLLSQLWDTSGKVTVPSFYDAVRAPTADELKLLDLHFDVETYQREFGVRAFAPEGGFSPLESNWLRPTLEINGLTGGYAGEGFKTVIPAKAIAKISCRLVPDQDPETILKNLVHFLQSHVPEGIELKIKFDHGAPAFRARADSPIAKITATAYEEVFGASCKALLTGGSVPIVGALAEVSGAEVTMMGMGLGSDNIHAPNEHFGLDRFEQGFLTMAMILTHIR